MADKFPLLFNDAWALHLAFLSDIGSHRKHVKYSTIGEGILFHEAISKLNAFKIKIQLYRDQFENHDSTNFSVFDSTNCPADLNMDFYIYKY